MLVVKYILPCTDVFTAVLYREDEHLLTKNLGGEVPLSFISNQFFKREDRQCLLS